MRSAAWSPTCATTSSRTVNQPLAVLAEGRVRRRLRRAGRERPRAPSRASASRSRRSSHGAPRRHAVPGPEPHPDRWRCRAATSRATSCTRLFEAAYWQRFQVELPEIRPVLVNLHTAVIGKRRPVAARGRSTPPSRARASPRRCGRTAPVWFDGRWLETPVYRREQLAEGRRLRRPGDRRAARLHDRDRAGKSGRDGRDRQSDHLGMRLACEITMPRSGEPDCHPARKRKDDLDASKTAGISSQALCSNRIEALCFAYFHLGLQMKVGRPPAETGGLFRGTRQ